MRHQAQRREGVMDCIGFLLMMAFAFAMGMLAAGLA